MWFFDTTPTGRILSRFSKDIYSIDNEIADFIDIFVFIVLQLMVVMLSIVVITPLCESHHVQLCVSDHAIHVFFALFFSLVNSCNRASVSWYSLLLGNAVFSTCKS